MGECQQCIFIPFCSFCVLISDENTDILTFSVNQSISKFSSIKGKENRIYIRVGFRLSLGMNLFSPFQPKREFKVYKSCKCSQIILSRVH